MASGYEEQILIQLCNAFIVPVRSALGEEFSCADTQALVGLATIVLIADVAARSAFEIRWDPGANARYFASAGNQGLAIPMPPAAWPGVYGVEACIAPNYPTSSRLRAALSNAGAEATSRASAHSARGSRLPSNCGDTPAEPNPVLATGGRRTRHRRQPWSH